MPLARLIARQLGRPSRITARVLNLANRRVNHEAVDLLAVAPGERVLEVGFGGGAALGWLAARTGGVAGIDRSPAAVAVARRRFPQLELAEADVAALPFEAASFDAVLTVHTIYFWPDPAGALAEIRRVLRPGGRLVLAADDKPQPRAVARHGLRSWPADALASLLADAGFASVRRSGQVLWVAA